MAHLPAFTEGQRRVDFSTQDWQDRILAALHERQTGQLRDDLTIDARLEAGRTAPAFDSPARRA